MPKIKDLAAVMLDNALSSFPVDSERYELAAAVRLNAAYCMQHLGVYQHENWRITEWLGASDATMWRAVEAYVSLGIEQPIPDMPVLTADLARRFYAMFEEDVVERMWGESAGDWDLLRQDLYAAAWKLVSKRMRYSEHFTPHTKGVPLFRNGQGQIRGV